MQMDTARKIIILTEITQTQKDKHSMYSLTSGLNVKQRIARLYSMIPEKLGNKENPKRDIHGSPWVGN